MRGGSPAQGARSPERCSRPSVPGSGVSQDGRTGCKNRSSPRSPGFTGNTDSTHFSACLGVPLTGTGKEDSTMQEYPDFNDNEKSSPKIGPFVIGAMLGAGIALLLAPAHGR